MNPIDAASREAIATAELITVCAGFVRHAIQNAQPPLTLSPADEQACVAKGVTWMVQHGAFIVNDALHFPRTQ